MRILTVLGTRPEIIRLSLIIGKLDALCDHILVNTGQNFDPGLNQLFFDQLGIRAPDAHLGAQGGFGEQVGTILSKVEKLLLEKRPDRFLVLGDTNSALAAVVAKRLGMPVYHMEAGNRCYDDRVPEEVNRRIIDHCSDILLPYTERSRQNLLAEGIPGRRIFVTGNPILEVIRHYQPQIDSSGIFAQLQIAKGRYFLVTLHRAENVDDETRLRKFAAALEALVEQHRLPVIVSTHPHTRKRLQSFGITLHKPEIRLLEPFGFFDFVALEQNAFCVLSDSGTVQEECCIFKVPNVTLRDVTERPETLECGSNILTGANPETILECVKTVLSKPPDWTPPAEYLAENVSQTVIKILAGYSHA
jgi:UDP-N-acetylglucosamine 2-epimerase (non-hydrolysing)